MRMGIYIACQLVFSFMLTTVFCLGSVVSPRMATAATYYVATTGNDSRSCSTAQTTGTPKQTINSGIGCLSAGDTLYIRGGTYTEVIWSPVNARIPSGTSWQNATTIAGYRGETVTLTHGVRLQDGFDSVPVAYVIFTNVTMRATCDPDLENGFWIGGTSHHVRITNSDVVGCTGFQIVSTTSYVEVINNLIHDAPVGHNPQQPVSTGTYGLYANGNHMLIDGNTIYNNTGYAVHLYHSGGNDASDNTIRNNIIYGNCFDDGQRGLALGAVIITSGQNNLFYNNIVYNNNCLGNGSAVSVSNTDNQLYNNTIYGNAGPGIELGAGATNLIIKNNIIYGNGGTIVDWGATGTVLSNNLTTDPRFVNSSANDFSLQAGSPAINTGMTVSVVTTDIKGVSRPQGATYDIGAYEYDTGSTPLPTPSNFRLISVSP